MNFREIFPMPLFLSSFIFADYEDMLSRVLGARIPQRGFDNKFSVYGKPCIKIRHRNTYC